jgi:hypothetical protein
LASSPTILRSGGKFRRRGVVKLNISKCFNEIDHF